MRVEASANNNQCFERYGTSQKPYEFYQTFWLEVSKPLVEALNYVFEIDQLSI